MLAEARAEVVQADQKASTLLAGLGIGFGLVLSGQLAGDWDPSQLSTAGEGLWWVGATMAVAAVVAVSLAVWPRFHAEDAGEGIAYWGHVAVTEDLGAFREAFKDRALSMADRTTHQLWHLAHVVKRKYTCVRWAMGFAGASIVTIGIAVLIFR